MKMHVVMAFLAFFPGTPGFYGKGEELVQGSIRSWGQPAFGLRSSISVDRTRRIERESVRRLRDGRKYLGNKNRPGSDLRISSQEFLENIAGIDPRIWELLVPRQSCGQKIGGKVWPDPGFSIQSRYGEGCIHKCHHGFGQARLGQKHQLVVAGQRF